MTSNKSTNVPARFRPTLWPELPLPPLPVIKVPLVVDGAGNIEPAYDWGDEDLVDVQEEFVLRQLPALDLDDLDAVVSVVKEVGGLTTTFHVPGRPDLDLPEPAGSGIHWTHVARYLRAARALTWHWVADRRETDLVEPWVAEGFPVQSQFEAWSQFSTMLNLGLEAYAPRVMVEFHNAPSSGWPDRGPGLLGRQPPDLFSALCLQVHQLVAEGLDTRTCQNHRCGKTFIRQQGRANNDSQRHHTGVKYCSSRCAKNQAEMDRRARKKAERRQDEGGSR